ncbi:hypothetical protein LJC23_06580, partial [Desulfovibrio sp. OttesenSCG-928-I05]|nr:hypothetical protein [Desulfovibrio sp. OttesenSCG-928-I05]
MDAIKLFSTIAVYVFINSYRIDVVVYLYKLLFDNKYIFDPNSLDTYTFLRWLLLDGVINFVAYPLFIYIMSV